MNHCSTRTIILVRHWKPKGIVITGRCKCIPVTSDATKTPQAHQTVDHAMGICPAATIPVSAAVAKEDQPTPWHKSKAKKLLQEDILSNEVKKCKGPASLHCSCPEHQQCKLTNFASNHCSLQKALASVSNVASTGRQAFCNDAHRIAAHWPN